MHIHIGGDYCVLWEENYDNQALRILKWQQKQKKFGNIGFSARMGGVNFGVKAEYPYIYQRIVSQNKNLRRSGRRFCDLQ